MPAAVLAALARAESRDSLARMESTAQQAPKAIKASLGFKDLQVIKVTLAIPQPLAL